MPVLKHHDLSERCCVADVEGEGAGQLVLHEEQPGEGWQGGDRGGDAARQLAFDAGDDDKGLELAYPGRQACHTGVGEVQLLQQRQLGYSQDRVHSEAWGSSAWLHEAGSSPMRAFLLRLR